MAAKAAFESRDHPTAVANARRRLGLYNATVYPLADELSHALPLLKEREPLWRDVETVYRNLVDGRYEADLALAYLHSAQRRVHHLEWKPVEYGFRGRAAWCRRQMRCRSIFHAPGLWTR